MNYNQRRVYMHEETMFAWLDGDEIQYKSKHFPGAWYNTPFPTWMEGNCYRVIKRSTN